MPKMVKTAYFQDKYYTFNELTELLGAERHQLGTAMHVVSFPEPSFRIGRHRHWEKQLAEPYLPALRDFLSGNSFLRNKDELIADMRKWIHEQDLSKREALQRRAGFLSWSSKGYTSRSVQYYGQWLVLVLSAMKE